MDKTDMDAVFMRRCLQLASLGRGHVSPNPMVGAVVVHRGQIIGEGYHRCYGQPHAEVNAINSVRDAGLLPECTLYVSLEPCSHYGKTPPCADLIVQKKIPRVVVGCLDPFPKVSGQGVVRLREAGIEVVTGILEEECSEMLSTFFRELREKKKQAKILKKQEAERLAGQTQSERAEQNEKSREIYS